MSNTTADTTSYVVFVDSESTAIYDSLHMASTMIGYVGMAHPGWTTETTDAATDVTTYHRIRRTRDEAEAVVARQLGITGALRDLPRARMHEWGCRCHLADTTPAVCVGRSLKTA